MDFKIRFTCGVGAGGGRGEGGGLIMLLCVGVSLKQLNGDLCRDEKISFIFFLIIFYALFK